MRVLVADAHAATRRAVRALLEGDRRFEVVAEAGDAAGAIDAAIHNRPDLCLLDVGMPGDGVAAVWEIAARLPRARLVMLADSLDERDVFAALRAGAVGYLLKDVNSLRLPHALWDVTRGNTAIPRELIAPVVEWLRHPGARRRVAPSADDRPRLTSREWQILSLLRDNFTTSEIAKHLSMTQATVRSHRARVIRKLDTAGEVIALDFAAKADRSSRGQRRPDGPGTSVPIPLRLLEERAAAIDAKRGCGS